MTRWLLGAALVPLISLACLGVPKVLWLALGLDVG